MKWKGFIALTGVQAIAESTEYCFYADIFSLRLIGLFPNHGLSVANKPSSKNNEYLLNKKKSDQLQLKQDPVAHYLIQGCPSWHMNYTKYSKYTCT
jgi:hypothetical protein